VDTLAGHNTNQSYFTYTTRCIVPSGEPRGSSCGRGYVGVALGVAGRHRPWACRKRNLLTH